EILSAAQFTGPWQRIGPGDRRGDRAHLRRDAGHRRGRPRPGHPGGGAISVNGVAIRARKSGVVSFEQVWFPIMRPMNSIAYSLNYARSEAVKRDLATGVSVCPSADGLTCNGTAWAGGWMVFYIDPTTAAVTPLQTVPALAGSNTVTAHGSATNGITFLSSGLATGLTAPMAQPLQINVCDTRGAAYARDIEVNVAGRVAASQNHGVAVDGVTPLVCP